MVLAIIMILSSNIANVCVEAGQATELVFECDFSAGNTDQLECISGSGEVREGALVSSSEMPTQYKLKTGSSEEGIFLSGDAVFEFDVKVPDEESWGGIQFCLGEQAQYNWGQTGYLLFVRGDGELNLLKGQNGNTAEVINPITIPEYSSGEFTHFKIEYAASTNNIKVYVNNAESSCIDVTDDAFSQGYVMLALNGNGVSEDNVKIYRKVVDENHPSEPVPPLELESVFNDTFSSETLDNWKIVGGTGRVENGALCSVESPMQCAPKTASASGGLYMLGDSVFEFDVLPTEEWGGIQFGLESQNAMNWDQTGYLLIVKKGGKIDLFKSTGNGKTALAENVEIPDYNEQDFTHIKVERFSDTGRIRVYSGENKSPCIDVEDTAFREGYVMMALHGAKTDNINIEGAVKDETEEFINDFILYKPLRDTTKIQFPDLPDNMKVEYVSSLPEGYIDSNWNVLKRPQASEKDINIDVKVRFIIDGKDEPIEKTFSVPISEEYTAPEVDQKIVQETHETYSDRKLGMFVHYVQHFTRDQKGALISDIDTLANSFDAKQFAEDMNDFGVEYVLFTVMHYNAETLYPSEVNKRWRDDMREEGSSSKKTYSDRDVIMDLYEELNKYGIELHLYAHPVDGHDFSYEDQCSTGYWECGGDANGSHERWNQYQNELYDEMTKRYQGKIKGLWFDGQFGHAAYNQHLMIDQERFRETLLAYDPTLILTVNLGNIREIGAGDRFPSTDFSAWEVEAPIINCWGNLNSVNPDTNPDDPSTWPVTTEQLAMVVGSNWWTQNLGHNMMHTPEELYTYTVMQASISRNGGYVLAAGCYPGLNLTDLWEGNLKETLIEFNKNYLTPVEESIKNTTAGIAYPTEEHTWLGKLPWGVSTESKDGKYIYLHVMNKPDGNMLIIPETADGSKLKTEARILNFDRTFTDIEITGTDNGYCIELPEGIDWDDTDTIIRAERILEEENPEVTYHTVTINGQKVQIEDGRTIARPAADPVKDGYKFTGWYVGDKKYDFAMPVRSDLLIEARWEKIIISDSNEAKPGVTGTNQESETENNGKNETPETGDMTNSTVWVVSLIISIGTTSVVLRKRIRK